MEELFASSAFWYMCNMLYAIILKKCSFKNLG
jgi:hypothetical protein